MALNDIFQILDELTRKSLDNPFGAIQHKEAGESLTDQSILVSKTGIEISIEDSSAPIRDAAGKVLGVVLVFRDVTARRIAERELVRWKQIFSSAGFGMFVADSKNGVIVDTNPTFATMHGYSANELLGTTLLALVAPDSRGDFEAALHIAGETGRHMFEHQHLRRDGIEFPAWSMLPASVMATLNFLPVIVQILLIEKGLKTH